MSNPTKKGRVPASQKSTTNSDFEKIDAQDAGSLLRIDPAIRRELDEKGLACRWISLREFSQNGNFHKNDWMPYKSDTLKKMASEFSFGTNPDGYLVRKEMVLAVKKKELQEAHKAKIARRTQIQSQATKAAAQEIKKTLGGTGAAVYEGYEETSRAGGVAFDGDDGE
jgi:hypothetical protein